MPAHNKKFRGTPMAKSVAAQQLKAMLSDGGEIALLDVREAGQYADGHPFFAVPCAYSRFEADVERLVPRRGVRMVLIDDGEGVAERAAKRAEALGYTDVAILDGGAPAWKAAGYTLFDGVNLPSKTFGELIEIQRHTPRITADELVAMQKRGDDMVIVDGRTWAEYQRFSIPGGISCPNGELALRIDAIAPSPKTKIVVNCAGRTRSIIGAQTLIDAGVPNEVVALENGTQGWFLAGYEVERGANQKYPDAPADSAAVAARRERVAAHAAKHGVEAVGTATVREWLADADRTTYLLDVRTAEEVAARPIAGFVHAPGGQLQQATDQWIGVKGARLVLVDTDGIRAPMVAAWLRQLGHDACVLSGAEEADKIAAALPADRAPRGPEALKSKLKELRTVTAQGLSALLWSGGGRALDLRSSQAFRDGHIPGSSWAIRPRLAAALGDFAGPVVLIADSPEVAAAASIDLAELGVAEVAVLAGGANAWRADGQTFNVSPDIPADSEQIDFIFHTHQRHDGNAEAARAYLAWEVNLVSRLDAQERGVFRL
jgi:rhodanese-related sulfurtransferase